ncbi:site-specific integrase [Pseudoxanthomonas indica]|uniref:Site-specific recombinase XerD n=1 Tax=Pseudoxanthomonas indica TaxID=428993 RepID=A0A1T5JZI1_9GAMM|nr:site-specific integrase [Pseudoxanthomonas indica]GGD45588.1 integrase [Pseudoxanthomonas indica]SKC56897.1 Site-specific recombinase XerD [Pseudoxanthomonas indica]
MGTITARRRSDGSTGYTAQIRLKQDGQVVHSESETFNTKVLAKEWLTRREAALDAQRARGGPVGKRMKLGDLVAWYETRERSGEPWGRTKKADLQRLRTGALRERWLDTLTRRDFVDFIDQRRRDGAGPATAGNDIIWMRGVFKAGAAALHIAVPLQELELAAEFLRSDRAIGKSGQRDRRMLADEETKLLDHFDGRRGKIPMVDIVRFAVLTGRRQEEITRLLRSDLDKSNGVALLRDVKHPRKKIGNHKRFRLLSDAWAIIDAQPILRIVNQDGTSLEDPRVFPFDPKSIGSAFTRATRLLGIEDLHFHDLRHEATSRLFERGYSIQEVAQFTLHESWTTLKRYTHLKPEQVPER